MKLRQNDSAAVAASKASISVATAYRIENDARLPSQKQAPRQRRRPDPLADIFEAEVVPLLKAAPDLLAVAIAILAEMLRRRHPTKAAGFTQRLSAHPRLADAGVSLRDLCDLLMWGRAHSRRLLIDKGGDHS